MYSEPKEALAQEIELKRPAVLAVSGLHNSGKTTLLEKLLPALRSRGLKVLWSSRRAVPSRSMASREISIRGTSLRRIREEIPTQHIIFSHGPQPVPEA